MTLPKWQNFFFQSVNDDILSSVMWVKQCHLHHPPVIIIFCLVVCVPFTNGWFIIVLPTLLVSSFCMFVFSRGSMNYFQFFPQLDHTPNLSLIISIIIIKYCLTTQRGTSKSEHDYLKGSIHVDKCDNGSILILGGDNLSVYYSSESLSFFFG